MLKKLKLVVGVSCLMALMIFVACGPQFGEAFDTEEQLEKDIELIEAYLTKKGYTEYDTLDNDIRVLVLDEGDGEAIEPEDIISFHYVGIFLNDTIFDTSIKHLALEQDIENAVDTVFRKAKNGTDSLDLNGIKVIEKVNYESGYSPIYSSTRNYTPYKTTHTSTGWYTEQLYPSFNVTPNGYIPGFASIINYAMFNLKIGGQSLALIPSYMAYGNNPSAGELRNKVLMFEIRPVQKR